MRMHLAGEPSAPRNLNGKQCKVYIPGVTCSRFKASTRMTSLIDEKQRAQLIRVYLQKNNISLIHY